MTARRLTAKLEIIKAGAQLEQPRTLASSKIAGSGEARSARVRVRTGVSPRPQQFGVVEPHPAVGGELQRVIETSARPVPLAGGGQKLAKHAPIKRPICGGAQCSPHLDRLSQGMKLRRHRSGVEIARRQ